MATRLRTRDYILLSLALAGDLIEGIRSVGGLMPFFRQISYGYAPPGYRRTSYLNSVSRLLSTRDIERKADADGKVFLELTSSGNERFKRKFPLFLREKQEWDKNFMVVVFDIKEVERVRRDALRLKLKQLGFGMMQESVYISPYHFEDDLRDFLESKGLGRYVFVFKAESLELGDYQGLSERVWGLSNVNRGYGEILDDINNDRSPIKEIWEKYMAVLAKDPMLPSGLLPKDWKRDEVVTELEKLALTKTHAVVNKT